MSQKKVQLLNPLSGNINVAGVITASSFVGGLTGNVTGTATTASGLTGTPNITVGSVTAASGAFSGNVSVGGTLTYQDVSHIDAVGIITAQQGIQVLANGLDVTGVSTFKSNVSIADSVIHTGDTDTAIRFPSADTFTVHTNGSERLRVDSSGHVLTSNFDTSSASGGGSKLWQTGSFHVQLPSSLSSSYLIRGFSGTTETFNVYNDGSALFKGNITVPDKIIHDGDTNTAIRFPTDDTFTVETAGSERFRISSTGGAHFNNGELIERINITAGKLSDNTNIDLEDGMAHLFTTTETTTATPNIRVNSSTTLNSVMATGDVISVSIITTAAAAAYSAQLTIDGVAVTEKWNGGSAPSAGGSSGNDLYSYTIIKTGDAAYTVLANVANFA